MVATYPADYLLYTKKMQEINRTFSNGLKLTIVTVAVAGSFDPLHRGHIRHLQAARKLGDRLVVITHPDEIQVKKKGYCFMPLIDRLAILDELRCVDEVVTTQPDGDGTVADALAFVRPDIFAKGGDRRDDSCMPSSELEVCQHLGIKIVYGVGDSLNSSSRLVDEVVENYLTAKGLMTVKWGSKIRRGT